MRKGKRAKGLQKSLTIALVLVTVVILVNLLLNLYISHKSNVIDKHLNRVAYPMLNHLKSLAETQKKSIAHTQKWVKKQDPEDRQELIGIITVEYPKIRVASVNFLNQLPLNRIDQTLREIFESFDKVTRNQKEILDNIETVFDLQNREKLRQSAIFIENGIVTPAMSAIEKTEMLSGEVQGYIGGLIQKKNKLSSFQVALNASLASIAAAILLVIVILLPGLYARRLVKAKEALEALSAGNLFDDLDDNAPDEVGDVIKEVNKVGNTFCQLKELFQEIKQGNYERVSNVFHEPSEMGEALAGMLSGFKEWDAMQKKVRHEDNLRDWANKGSLRFNEILRVHNDNLDELSLILVKELVKYTGAAIGGVYLVKEQGDKDILLTLNGFFAYERRRYMDIATKPGEGMVGTVFIEKNKMYLREVPEGYLKISSGLGEAPPRELLILPLIYNDDVLGVIELATIDTFKEHVIAFIEEVANSFASVISIISHNIRTKQLLAESNFQAQQLKAQEEEMRQNMEELMAIQEDNKVKYVAFEKTIEESALKEEAAKRAIHDLEINISRLQNILDKMAMPVYWKDENLIYRGCNLAYLKILGIKAHSDIIGKTGFDLLPDHEKATLYREEEMNILRDNEPKTDVIEELKGKGGALVNMKVVKYPVVNSQGISLGLFAMVDELTDDTR